MNSKEFKSGQVIFKQGDSELCMYDIQRGRVGIYSAYGTPAALTRAPPLLPGLTAASVWMNDSTRY